jgi:hypothetical protein
MLQCALLNLLELRSGPKLAVLALLVRLQSQRSKTAMVCHAVPIFPDCCSTEHSGTLFQIVFIH